MAHDKSMDSYLDHETRYRGEGTVQKRASVRILICGVGALGSRLLDSLIRQGYSSVTVLDKDRVDRDNLGTQNYGLDDVGRMKATQCSIQSFRRLKIKVGVVEKELTPSNASKLLKGFDLVIDMFDNAKSRNLVRDTCKALGTECLHVGMSGDGFAEIEWNAYYTAYEAPVDEDTPCEYPLAANLVYISVALASEIVNGFVDEGQKRSIQFTLKDMNVDLKPRL